MVLTFFFWLAWMEKIFWRKVDASSFEESAKKKCSWLE
jgi:hypothetical protein